MEQVGKMGAARKAALADLFRRFGEELADLLDGDDEPRDTPSSEPRQRTPRRITEIDKQRARNIARRIGRV